MKTKYQLTSSHGISYPIGAQGLTIGRSRSNSVYVSDVNVSRLHARILYAGERYWIRDENSQSGTFVNGQRVMGQQAFNPGDVLQIGSMTFSLTPASQAAASRSAVPRERRNQLVYVGILGALLVICVIALGSAGGGGGGGKITWQLSQADFTVRAGASGQLLAEFTPASSMTGLTVETSSSLQGMIKADLVAIPDVQANQKYALLLTAQSPAIDQSGTFQGEVYLSRNGTPLDGRLPVRITVNGLSSDVIPSTVGEPSEQRVVSDGGRKLIKDELVIGLKFETPNPAERAKEIAKSTGGLFLGSIPDSFTYQIVYSAADLSQLEAIRLRVLSMPDVEFASHDFISEGAGKNPDDSKYDSWDENSPAGNNWHLEFIKAPSAWDLTTGSSSVNIAVLDYDIDKDHEDLNDNLASLDGHTPNVDGHGTHVSGLICGEGNNKQGISGVMWDCTLRGYDFGSSSNSTVGAAEKMVKAANEGARIVNMSLQWIDNNKCGTPGTDATLKAVAENNAILARSILYAQRENKDVLWVFAAGNECRDSKYASPASLTANFPLNTIAVASVDQNGSLSNFSNFGELVTVAAPGGGIYSTLPSNSYGNLSGTSMAAPQVTGLAGLVLSQHSDYTSSQIKQCILSGAQSGGREVTGQHFKTINALDAVKCEGTIDLPGKVDIVFAIDLTGSMGEELERVKNEVKDVVHELTTVASPSTDFHFGLVSYEDYPGRFNSSSCGSSYADMYGEAGAKSNGDLPFRIDLPLTADVNALYSTVPAMSLGNGADGPEAYSRVFWELGTSTSGINFRSDALKLVVNFGDSIPHDTNLNQGVADPPLTDFSDTGIDPGPNNSIDCGGDDIDLQDKALPAMVASKVHLLHIDSSGADDFEPYWRYWASITGGAYASINADGTIPGDLSLPTLIMDLLKTIAETP